MAVVLGPRSLRKSNNVGSDEEGGDNIYSYAVSSNNDTCNVTGAYNDNLSKGNLLRQYSFHQPQCSAESIVGVKERRKVLVMMSNNNNNNKSHSNETVRWSLCTLGILILMSWQQQHGCQAWVIPTAVGVTKKQHQTAGSGQRDGGDGSVFARRVPVLASHHRQDHFYDCHHGSTSSLSQPFLSLRRHALTSSGIKASAGKDGIGNLEYDAKRIRNFSIIAHIDHGKSTLADRILESTETVSARDMTEQLLDNMDLERERGITIKLQAARVLYKSKVDGEIYTLNLCDTPGHVDFSYEVSRSLAACEGALLVVDASQGIEAQTLANVYLALENDLEIIPVLNKIDLPAADPDRVAEEIEETIGLDCSNIIKASAKAGIGIEDILESIVQNIPPPKAELDKPFRALIFDSYYDSYRGVVVFFRVVDGQVRKGDKIRFMASGAEHEVTEVGVMTPQQVQVGVSFCVRWLVIAACSVYFCCAMFQSGRVLG